MVNNKGFTLIELLASIAILAIISLIAVPSMLSISLNNKKEVYVNDAKRLISIAKYEANKHAEKKELLNSSGLYYYENNANCILKHNDNSCISTTDIDVSPNGEKYTYGYVKTNEVCLTDDVYTVKSTNIKNLSVNDVYEYVNGDCE